MRKEKKKITRGMVNKIIILSVPAAAILAFIIYVIVALCMTLSTVATPFSNNGSDATALESASSVSTAITDFKDYYKSGSAYDNIERMTYSEYAKKQELVIRFQSTEYDYASKTSKKFTCAIAKHEEYTTKLDPINSSYFVRAALCLYSDYVGFEQYYTSLWSFTSTYVNSKLSSSAYEKTATIDTSNYQFPYTTTAHWPFYLKSDTPKAYLYLQYKYTENGVTVPKQYVIEYSFDDYFVTQAEYEADKALDSPLGLTRTLGGIQR